MLVSEEDTFRSVWVKMGSVHLYDFLYTEALCSEKPQMSSKTNLKPTELVKLKILLTRLCPTTQQGTARFLTLSRSCPGELCCPLISCSASPSAGWEGSDSLPGARLALCLLLLAGWSTFRIKNVENVQSRIVISM